MMSINHQLPSPAINVCKNDRIIVDATNHMDGHVLSLHWHGLHQKDTPWMDGVPMVTQCPIVPGTTFRYDFIAAQSGSHFYHAHSGLQRVNGIAGVLNVRDVDDPNADSYDFDLPEHSILLLDWYDSMIEDKAPGFESDMLFADSLIINGFGDYFNSKTNTSMFAPMAVFYVERGKKHRFRIVNARAHNFPADLSVCILKHFQNDMNKLRI